MNIRTAIQAAKNMLVDRGGEGPAGTIGREYLSATVDLLGKGYGIDEHFDAEVFNQGGYGSIPAVTIEEPAPETPTGPEIAPEGDLTQGTDKAGAPDGAAASAT